MALLSDPISGTLAAFFNRALEKHIWERVTLLVECGIGGSVSFLVVCGLMLSTLAPGPIVKSIGAGMAAAAVAIFATVQTSDNAKGLKIAFTQQVADEKLDHPTTTIQR